MDPLFPACRQARRGDDSENPTSALIFQTPALEKTDCTSYVKWRVDRNRKPNPGGVR